MDLAGISIIAGTGMIMGADVWATIDEQLHDHTPEIGEDLRTLVRAKTPILTGALFIDMSYEAYTNPQGYGAGESDLVWIYSEEIEQQAFWDRIYVQYQEGGALGEHTFTNAPREMFFKTASTDGLAEVIMWAEKWVSYANLLCVSGAGVPWKP
jgi:hypothetical protein